MRIYDIIDKKRHAQGLTDEEIAFVVDGLMSGEICDYQVASLLMAICIQGMDEDEIFNLTKCMLNSGEIFDLSQLGDNTVDKHSTGGVGDKTTLIVAPIVASLGARVAKMSGRGLGFTGGTIDKLESIDGFKTTLSKKEFISQVEKIGISVIGQSESLAPADKKLYALRDVTATVESIPLIASSIMSKKLASGAKSIVLDVKCGSGAFMKNIEDATILARTMIKLGNSFDRRVRALITNMDVPLGTCVGNSLEIWEAIQVLCGKGEKKLTELCVSLASNMLMLSLDLSYNEAEKRVLSSIKTGSALSKLRELVSNQGGDVSFIDEPERLLGSCYTYNYVATRDGYISKIDAEGIGISSMLLGAGRTKKGEEIDHLCGIMLKKQYGEKVSRGDILATLYYSDKARVDSAVLRFESSVTISDTKPEEKELIYVTL